MQRSPVSKIIDGIYKIQVPMPNFTPPSVNAYLIKGEPNSLLIDTGLDLDRCERILRNAMDELDISPDRLDILITHSHGDHTGMLHRFVAPDTKVYLNEFLRDYNGSYRYYVDGLSKTVGTSYLSDTGCTEVRPEEVYPVLITIISSTPIDGQHIFCKDGDVLHYGGRDYIYITTPGHCEDHCALYSPQDGLLFSGDMLLNRTYPSITDFLLGDNHQSEYYASLRKLDSLEVKTVCSGHGVGFDMKTRIEQTRQHHFQRAFHTAELLQAQPLTIQQLAQKVNMKYHCRTWEQLSLTKKFTAIGENMAYISFLTANGIVNSYEDDENIRHYFSTSCDANKLRSLIF